MNVSSANIIDGLLPSPVVKKILLEGGGGVAVQSAYRLAPHVASTVNAAWSYYDISEVKSGFGEKTLNVTLNIAVRDVMDYPNVTQWLDQHFAKYIRVVLLQMTNEQARSELNTLSAIATKSSLLDRINLLYEQNKISSSDIKSFSLWNETPVELEDMNISDLTRKDMVINDSGDKIFEATFESTFEGLPEKPQTLAYMVFTYVDFNALAEDYPEIDISEIEGDAINVMAGASATGTRIIFPDLMGDPLFENVFLNGSMKSIGGIYHLADGSIYSGPVHFAGNQPMTGHQPHPNSKKLTFKNAINSKIQDFRVRNIPKTPMLGVDIESLFPSITMPSKNAIDTPIRPKQAYFSDAFLTQRSDQSSRGLFFADFERILIEEGMFPVSLQGEMRNEIFLNTKITGLSILRNEMYGSKPTVDNSNSFFQDTDKKIVSSQDPEETTADRKIITVKTETKKIGSSVALEEVDVNLTNPNSQLAVRSFAFEDHTTTTNITYKYGVEFTVLDGTLEVAKTLISNLDELSTSLEDSKAMLGVPTNLVVGTKQLTDQAVSENTSTLNELKDKVSRSLTRVFEFSRGHNIELSKSNQQDIIFKLVFMLTNMGGIDEVIKFVSDIRSTFHRAIGGNIVGFKGAAVTSDVDKSSPRRRQLYVRHFFDDTIKIEPYFVELLSLDNSSYDAAQVAGETAVRRVSSARYRSRVDVEKAKFFSDSATIEFDGNTIDGNLDKTKYSYLTPTKFINKYFATEDAVAGKFGIGDTVVSNTNAAFDQMIYNLLKSIENKGIHAVNDSTDNIQGTPAGQEGTTTANNVLTFGAVDSSCTIPEQNVFDQALTAVAEAAGGGALPPVVGDNTEVQSSPASEIVFPHTSIHDSQESQALFGNVDVTSVLFFKYLTLLESLLKFIPNDMTFDLATLKTKIEGVGGKSFTGFSQYDFNLPVQIKNLFGLTSGGSQIQSGMVKNPVNFTSLPVTNKVFKNYQTISKAFFLYQNIFQAEYLLGFELSEDGYRMMKKPIFKLITNETLDSSAQASILCRMRPYEGGKKRMSSVPVPEKLRIAPSDQVFVLQKSATAGAPIITDPPPPVEGDLGWYGGGMIITYVPPSNEEVTETGTRTPTPEPTFTGGGYGG